MQTVLKNKVTEALKSLGIEGVEPVIEYPADLSHGDFATNAAMAAAANFRKKGAKELEDLSSDIKPREVIVGVVSNEEGLSWSSPRDLAEKLKDILTKAAIPGVKKIEVAGPGFINFRLTREYFSKTVNEVDEGFGKNESLKNKKILLEKSAPNLFKPFHIGHLVNLSIGESLSRLMQFSGGDVTDIAYPSDISLGVAKAVWAIMEKGVQGELTINTLGECYVYGTQKYDEDEDVKEKIIEINKKLNAKEAGVEWDIYQKGREINLEYFERITARLGSSFSGMFFESDAGEVGKDIVEKNIGKVFQESQGAVIFPGEEYDLHTRVFLTSNKIPVYETKDIGLLKLKFEKYNPDLSIVITDVEQKQYFEVLKKAAELIQPELSDRSLYWQHGRLRFAGGKVSSRYGNVPLAEDLVEQVKEIVSKKAKDENPEVAEQVALASLRYAFLRSSAGKNIVFDFEKSVSVEGDSGPYLQYSYARAMSVLNKADGDGAGEQVSETVPEFERLLPRFPAVVERAASEYEPHYVTTYLTELASSFNSWYATEKIIGSEDEQYKFALTKAFARTMKNGLWLLGIEAPEKM